MTLSFLHFVVSISFTTYAFLRNISQTLNYVHQYVPKGTNYFDKTIRIDKNPIKTALNVCKHLISKRVYAVVVSHDEKDSSGHDLSPAAVSYTSGFYQIPVIGISSRDAAFSDKNIHVSFLRTVPPYYHQADVWLEMLSHFGYTKVCLKITFFSSHISLTKELEDSSTLHGLNCYTNILFAFSLSQNKVFPSLQWSSIYALDEQILMEKSFFHLFFPFAQVIIIHSSDTDGRAILGRFQTTSQTNYDDIDVRANVESIVEFEPKLESFVEHLAELKTAQSRVYLLYAK